MNRIDTGKIFFGHEQWGKKDDIDAKLEKDKAEILRNLDVPVDIQKRIDDLFEEHEWELLAMPDGTAYPNVEQWLNFCLENQRAVRFYPAFIADEKASCGRRFVKVQIRTIDEWEKHLRREFDVLKNGIFPGSDINALEYIPRKNPGSVACLVSEAIPFSEGRSATIDEWDEEKTNTACDRLLELENITANHDLLTLNHFPEGYSSVRHSFREVQQFLLTKGIDISDFLDHSEELFCPTVVHGDAAPHNIIIRIDGSVKLIDWEKGGIGFMGQDVAKLYNRLISRPELTRLIEDRFNNYQGKDKEIFRSKVLNYAVIIDLLKVIKRSSTKLNQSEESYRYPRIQKELDFAVSRLKSFF